MGPTRWLGMPNWWRWRSRKRNVARDWDRINDYATASGALVNIAEGTFAWWVAPDFAPSTTTVYQFCDVDTVLYILYHTTTANQMALYTDGRQTTFTVTGLWSSGAWTHFLVLYRKSDNTQRLFINGTEVTGDTPTGTWGSNTAGTKFYLGSERGATPDPSKLFDGDIAEFAHWSVMVDAGEIRALAMSVAPPLVRPQSLVAYWPIGGNDSPEPDRWKNRYDLTLSGGPPKTDHPRMFYPSRVRVPSLAAAGAVAQQQGRMFQVF